MPGVNNIRIRNPRRNFEVTKVALLFFFQGIINSGKIPIPLKKGIDSTLYKGAAGDCVENYFPISILPCMIRVLQKRTY